MKFLLSLALLIALPFAVSYPVDMYGTVESGAFFTAGGPTDFTASVTASQAIKTDTTTGFRFNTFQTAHYVTADSTIESFSAGTQVDKYFKAIGVQWGVTPRVGMYTDISDGRNQSAPLVGLRFSGYIKDWFGITVGADQIFQDVGNNTSVVGGITLTPPAK